MFNNKKAPCLLFTTIVLWSSFVYAAGETSYGLASGILKFVSYILITFLVIIITIYGTRFIVQSSKKFANGRYITVLDKIAVDTNTKILLIEVNNQIYLLAINNNHIEKIDKVAMEEFEKLKFGKQLEMEREKYLQAKGTIISGKNLEKFINKLDKFFNKEDKNNEE